MCVCEELSLPLLLGAACSKIPGIQSVSHVTPRPTLSCCQVSLKGE